MSKVRRTALPTAPGTNAGEQLIAERSMDFGGWAMRSVLETLSEPLIVLGPQRQVHFTNAAAEAAFQAGEGLSLRGSTLVAEIYEIQTRLTAALCAAAAAQSGSFSVLLKQRDDGRCSVLHLSPLASGDIDREANPQDIRILGNICLNSALPDIQTLKQAFGLSQTEAEIALLITAGYSPRRIASRRESSEETVRWHIKNIYSKTYTSRLVDLALQLAAARSPFFAAPHAPLWRDARQPQAPVAATVLVSSNPQAARGSSLEGRPTAPAKHLNAAAAR